METVRFGSTGLKVAPLAFGTMTLGGTVEKSASRDLLSLAWDRGINFIDTANTYNKGESERIVGKWLKDKGIRDRAIIASKVRYPVGDDPNTAGLAPKVLMTEVEASLRRLGTDYLDIYYLHQPDDDTPLETTWRCLDALVASGKVRYIGLSNFAAWQVVDAIRIAEHNGWVRPTVIQSMYNLITRTLETEFLPMTMAHDLGTCVYNPLAGGLLTGKHSATGKAKKATRLSDNEMYRKRYWHPRQRKAAKMFAETARAFDRTPVEMAVRFLLDRAEVDVVLLGATRSDQLDETLSVADAPPLTNEETAKCDEIWRELYGPVPRYNRTNKEMHP